MSSSLARLTRVAPIAPVAPGWFSTTNVWPRLTVILLAIVRPMVSVDPPGGNGTTTVTGFSG